MLFRVLLLILIMGAGLSQLTTTSAVLENVNLEDVEIDYEDTTFHSAFKIRNPNVKQTCGCGSSFG